MNKASCSNLRCDFFFTSFEFFQQSIYGPGYVIPHEKYRFPYHMRKKKLFSFNNKLLYLFFNETNQSI